MSDVTDNKKDFLFYDFFFWVILAVVFPVSGGNLTTSQVVHVVIYLGAVFYLGELLLGSIELIEEMPFLIRSGIYIVFGSLISGILFLLIPYKIIIYALAVAFSISLCVQKRIKFRLTMFDFLCVVPFVVMLFWFGGLEYAVREAYQYGDVDNYYYIALVESIKSTHTIFDATFHRGIPIHYSPLPFAAVAQMADFAGIKSQFALYGVYMILLSVSACCSVAYATAKVHDSLLCGSPDRASFGKKLLLASLMVLFLGPLHFVNIVKGNFPEALLMGEGYLLPVSSPGFAAAIFMTGMLFLLVLGVNRYGWRHKVIVICLVVLVVMTKVALFLPLGAFLGFLSLYRFWKGEPDLLWTLLIALPLSLLLYKITLGSSDSVFAMAFTLDGHFPTRFRVLGEKYFPGHSDVVMILGMLALSLLMWLNAKLFFLSAAIYDFRRNADAVAVIVSGFLALVIGTLPGFFLDAYGRSSAGLRLFSIKYDMGQFARSSLFIITVISIIVVMHYIFSHKSKAVRYLTLSVVMVWMGLIAISFFSYHHKDDALGNKKWFLEVSKDYEKVHPKLMAMIGNEHYSGQMISAAGINPWYCTGLREEGDGYINSKKAYDRNYLFRKLFDEKIDVFSKRNISNNLIMNGLDCIVATPDTLNRINVAVRDSIIERYPGTRWMYRFK